MILSIKLWVLAFQLLASAVIILFIGYLCDMIKKRIWPNFKEYPWYKKIALILVAPVILIVIAWFTAFVWLGPENCHLILKF